MNLDPNTHLLLLRDQADRAGRPGRRHAVLVRRDPWLQRVRRHLRGRQLEPAPGSDLVMIEERDHVLTH